MQDLYLGITQNEMRILMEKDLLPIRFLQIRTSQYLQQLIEECEEEERQWLARQMTAAQLCEVSGLTPEELAALADARLLLPDRPRETYRPKLAGWARKLSYLLHDGWTILEIKNWAKERWETGNPREWPPDRLDGGKIVSI
jgi:hypothetical protein